MILIEIDNLDNNVIQELYHFNPTIKAGFRNVLCTAIKKAVDETIPDQDCTVTIVDKNKVRYV